MLLGEEEILTAVLHFPSQYKMTLSHPGIRSPYLHGQASLGPCSYPHGQFTSHTPQLDPCMQHAAVFFLITKKLSVHIEHGSDLLGQELLFPW